MVKVMMYLFFFYLLTAFALSIVRPNYFIAFYLLASSRFLGLFNADQYFEFNGVAYGFSSLNIIAFVSALLSFPRYKIQKKHLYFLSMFSLFVFYGYLFPVFMDYESLQQAVIAGKDFLALSFFLYLAMKKEKIKPLPVLSMLKYIGIYIALCYMAYGASGLSLPAYQDDSGFRAYFPTYISLSWFICYFFWRLGATIGPVFVIQSAICFFGILLSGHDSLLIGTITSLFALDIAYTAKMGRLKSVLFKKLTILALIGTVFLILPGTQESALYGAKVVVSGESESLISRETYNKFRWDAIRDQPISGYGFIHKSASVVSNYRPETNSRFMENFGVIDSGYVDLLIRFGIFGGFLYLITWASPLKLYFKGDINNCLIGVVLSYYLAQYFLVNYTWSVFSYSHGLIPGLISVYFILLPFDISSYSKFELFRHRIKKFVVNGKFQINS